VLALCHGSRSHPGCCWRKPLVHSRTTLRKSGDRASPGCGINVDHYSLLSAVRRIVKPSVAFFFAIAGFRFRVVACPHHLGTARLRWGGWWRSYLALAVLVLQRRLFVVSGTLPAVAFPSFCLSLRRSWLRVVERHSESALPGNSSWIVAGPHCSTACCSSVLVAVRTRNPFL